MERRLAASALSARSVPASPALAPEPTCPLSPGLRLQERLTLKHKNTSRWARRAIKRGQTLADAGTRAAVAEQLRLGEELRQRVRRPIIM